MTERICEPWKAIETTSVQNVLSKPSRRTNWKDTQTKKIHPFTYTPNYPTTKNHNYFFFFTTTVVTTLNTANSGSTMGQSVDN